MKAVIYKPDLNLKKQIFPKTSFYILKPFYVSGISQIHKSFRLV